MLNAGKLENIKLEMMILDIDILVLIQVYFPTSDAENDAIEEVYSGLEELCKLAKGEDNLIIMGDWNAIVGEGAFGLGTINERGDRLVDFCKQHDMTITNTFQNIHRRKRYTWKMPGDIGRYQIDYIIVRKRFRNQVHRCKTYPGADVNSDHNLLMMKCNVVYKKLTRRNQTTRKYDLRMLKDNTINTVYTSYTNEKLKLNPLLPSDTTEGKWNKMKDAIHNAASNTLKRNSPEPRKAWINDNIIRDIEERRKYKNAKDNHGIRRYKELKNKINKEATFAREKWLEDKCQGVEQLLRNNSLDQAFNIIKKFFRGKKKLNSRLRDIDGNLILDNDKIVTRWKQHLEALYQEGEAASLNNNNNPMQGEVILRDEFNRTLKLMKTGKATGTDDIAMELIQNASTELQDELFKLVNDIYTIGEIPKDFKESIIIPIPKKATADKCNEFRTKSVMAHAAKIQGRRTSKNFICQTNDS
ncbi:hypothetical protein QTP88_004234 [Uroleucon formosanum]